MASVLEFNNGCFGFYAAKRAWDAFSYSCYFFLGFIKVRVG